MKVILSDSAEADIEEIGNHVARDDPRRAMTFVRDLRDVARRLSHNPTAYALVPRYERHGIRRRCAGNYLIFYHIDDKAVCVERILGGAPDHDPLLFPDA